MMDSLTESPEWADVVVIVLAWASKRGGKKALAKVENPATDTGMLMH